MGFLDWLTGRPPFSRFEDSFAMTRTSLWAKLKIAILQQQQLGIRVWIVTHFADTFVQLQELLDEWQIEYEICDRKTQPQSALESTRVQDNSVLLVLSDLLTLADSTDLAFDDSVTIAMIVVEKHPLVEIDHQLEAFSKSLPCRVRFGYYLAIDDVVVKKVINETTIQILKQLGMKDHELITSNMVTRRLDKVLKREGNLFSTNHRADSAEEWYQLNQPAE